MTNRSIYTLPSEEAVNFADQYFEAEWIGNRFALKPASVKSNEEDRMNTPHNIYQMIAFHNLHRMTRPPEDCKNIEEWDRQDKRLFNLGVRVGQIWETEDESGNIIHLGTIGYHKKGFIWAQVRILTTTTEKRQTTFYTALNVNHSKAVLIAMMQSSNAVLTKTARSKFLDKDGFALPGYEVEVAFCCLYDMPIFWYEPTLQKDVFVSACENGHYIFSEKILPPGIPCSENCQESKHNAVAKAFFNQIIHKIMRTKSSNKRSIQHLSQNGAGFTYSDCKHSISVLVNSASIGERLSKAFSNPKIESPTWLNLLQGKEGEIFQRATTLISIGEVKSGDIIAIQHPASGYVKVHRRSCGYPHLEVSRTTNFSGQTDWEFVKSIPLNTQIKIGNEKIWVASSKNKQFIVCPICKSDDPILNLEMPPSFKIPTIKKGTEYIESLSPGEIVLYNKKLHVVDIPNHWENTAWSHGLLNEQNHWKNTRSLFKKENMQVRLFNRSGKSKIVPYKTIQKLKKTNNNIEHIFYDKNGFASWKKYSISHWASKIIPGSILVATRGPLAGHKVTCVSQVFKIGKDLRVDIAESKSSMSLYTELRALKTFPISEGTILTKPQNKQQQSQQSLLYRVQKISTGQVLLENTSSNKITKTAKIALDILINDGIIEIYIPNAIKAYQIDSQNFPKSYTVKYVGDDSKIKF